jgi:hypothetical protein
MQLQNKAAIPISMGLHVDLHQITVRFARHFHSEIMFAVVTLAFTYLFPRRNFCSFLPETFSLYGLSALPREQGVKPLPIQFV